MNIVESLQAAWSVFRATRGDGRKDASAVVPTWEDKIPQYSPVNFYNAAANGYRRNELIFACVNYRADTISAATLRLLDEAGQELPAHPARLLLKRPNPVMTEADFWQANTAMKDLGGAMYWWKERSKNGRVVALWPLRPDRVQAVPSRQSYIGGYQYTYLGEPVTFPSKDVLAFTDFDPLSPYYGWPPAQVAARSVDVDNSTTDFVKLFFQNGAMPQGLLSSKMKLSDPAVEDIKRRWKEKYGGYTNWADVAVLDSDATYQQMGMTFKDMEFGSLDSRNESRICMVFRISPILINAMVGMNRSTYNNYKEARTAFLQDAAASIWKHFSDEYAMQMAGEYGDAPDCRFDLTEVPAYQDLMTAKLTAAGDSFGKGILRRNEARKYAGFDEVEGEDVFFDEVQPEPLGFGGLFGRVKPDATTPEKPDADQPAPVAVGTNTAATALNGAQIASLVEVIQMVSARTLDKIAAVEVIRGSFPTISEESVQRMVEAALNVTIAPDVSGATTKTRAMRIVTKEMQAHDWEYKKRHGRKRDQIARAYELRFRDAAQGLFADEAKRLRKLLNGEKAALFGAERKDDIDFKVLAEKILTEINGGRDEWIKTFTPLIRALIGDTGEQIALDFGISFDIKNPLVDEFLKTYVPKFADQINDTTRNALVVDMLHKAQDEGWSIPKLAESIKGQYAQWDDSRSTIIARTETIRASNAGGIEAIRQADIPGKQWLATNDDRTRDDHVEADGQIVGIDEPFDVGGEELDYPGDPSGSAGNTIQCRCTVLPVFDQDLQKALAMRREKKARAMPTMAKLERKAKSDGAIAALWLDETQVAALWASFPDVQLPDGCTIAPSNDHHITLAYLGNTSQLDDAARQSASAALQLFASTRSRAIVGVVSGLARFSGDGVDAIVALYDSPELTDLRGALVEALAHVLPVANHGFTAHITMAYVPSGVEVPMPPLTTFPMAFDKLTLAWGDKHEQFKLGGSDD